MSFNVNTGNFQSSEIAEMLETISRVGSRRKLGIKRWDNFLDVYPFSGVVTIPVKLGYRVFREPFYFAVEKVNGNESIRVRPVKGEQWSGGDVYGFFGLYDFGDYEFGTPIYVVEGLSDWAVWKRYYKYTLASLTAGVTYRQAFYLAGLTDYVFLGYDPDEAGSAGRKSSKGRLEALGCSVGYHLPVRDDWAGMYEDEYGRVLVDKSVRVLLEKLNTINRLRNG